MSSKEKNYNVFFVVAIIISVIVILGTVTYAFYQSSINGNVSGTIAKWNFTANDQASNFELDLGKLYPGKTETYNITLSAANSDLDVYYELIFTDASINYKLYWDSSYTKPLRGTNSYVGRYGVITKGSNVTIPLYLNWPYDSGNIDHYYPEEVNTRKVSIEIIARQYTGYNGPIPMNLLGYDLISYKSVFKETMPISYRSTCQLNVESINNTSGYLVITNSNRCTCVWCME